jgi:tetratricopeptide (TPR) repeat protein
LDGYLKNWDALSSMLTRGRSFSGRERNCAFLNLGSKHGSLERFADVSAVIGLDFIEDGRAVIATDWDQDGDLDLWQTNREGPRLRFVQNKLKPGKNWVAFELVGTKSNRDGIGTVLRLKIGEKTITRALTAGDGFMSQSGKRLHFGLGDSEEPPISVTVNWPGATAETFSEITPGNAYQLTQDSGKAEIIARKKTAIADEENELVVPIPSEQARIILSHRIPSPPLDYVDFKGELRKHEPDTSGSGKPTLINLWASWCPNCKSELSDLKKRYGELSKKGLEILALTVEGVPQGDARPDVSGAKGLVAKSDFPFLVGATDQNALRLLTVLHDRVITRQRPLPLPSSFLIDRWGRLAAIYKGPVSADQLLADLDLLEAEPKTIAEHAFPFPGRDGTQLFPLGDLDFAKAYLAGGDPDTARREAIKVTEAPLTNNAEADLARRTQAWYFLGTLEQGLRNWKEAAEAYQSALDFSPENVVLKIPLGVSLWQAGEQEDSRKILEEVAEAGQKNAGLSNALGKAYLQIKQHELAATAFEKAITLEPKQSGYQLSLALAYQTGGQPAKAVAVYENLLKAQPTSANIKNNLALLLATSSDAEIRDGQRALKLAKEVIAQAGESHPSPLDSLGAALAETGDFDGAVVATRKAISAARAIGRNDLFPKLQAKINLYQSGKPYRFE